MIDIDIAQQLFPNPATMIIQLCATAVLFYFVRKYLWGPARELMNKRSEAVQSTLTDAEKYLEEAKGKQKEAHEEVSQSLVKSQNILSKTEQEAKALRDDIVEQAKKDATLKLEKAREEIAIEKKQMRQEMVEEMIDVAMSATQKLINEKVDQEQDQKAIERFVKEMSEQHESAS